LAYGNYKYLPDEVANLWKVLASYWRQMFKASDIDLMEHVWYSMFETSKTHRFKYIRVLYSRALESFYNAFYEKRYWVKFEFTSENQIDTAGKVFKVDGSIAKLAVLQSNLLDTKDKLDEGSQFTFEPGTWVPKVKDSYERFWEGNFKASRVTFATAPTLPVTYWSPEVQYNRALAAKLFGMLVDYARVQNWGGSKGKFSERQYVKAVATLIRCYLDGPCFKSIYSGLSAMLYLPTADADGVISQIVKNGNIYTVKIIADDGKEEFEQVLPEGFDPRVAVGDHVVTFEPLTNAVHIGTNKEENWKHTMWHLRIPQNRFTVFVRIRNDVPFLSDTLEDAETFLDNILSASRDWRMLFVDKQNDPLCPMCIVGETEMNPANIAPYSTIISLGRPLVFS